MMGKTIRLQPITLVTPTREGIYAPSRILPIKEMDSADFFKKVRGRSRLLEVSFAQDGCSNPQTETAYNLDCWYIVAE